MNLLLILGFRPLEHLERLLPWGSLLRWLDLERAPHQAVKEFELLSIDSVDLFMDAKHVSPLHFEVELLHLGGVHLWDAKVNDPAVVIKGCDVTAELEEHLLLPSIDDAHVDLFKVFGYRETLFKDQPMVLDSLWVIIMVEQRLSLLLCYTFKDVLLGGLGCTLARVELHAGSHCGCALRDSFN